MGVKGARGFIDYCAISPNLQRRSYIGELRDVDSAIYLGVKHQGKYPTLFRRLIEIRICQIAFVIITDKENIAYKYSCVTAYQ